MPPKDPSKNNYAILYGKSAAGAQCKAGSKCSNETSPGKIILGQLRWDSKSDRFSASYHLGCVSEQSALNYLEKWRLEHPGEEDAGAVDDFPGLKELKDEHVDDVKACLENLLLGDGVDAEQREWLETVSGGDVAAAKKKAPAKKKPAPKKKLAPKKKTTKAKEPAKKRKAPAKKSAPAKKKPAAKKKKKVEEEEAEDDEAEEEEEIEEEEAEAEDAEDAEEEEDEDEEDEEEAEIASPPA